MQASLLVPNCAGGLNAGLHPSLIADNEFSRLENWFVKGDSIFRRPGSRIMTDVAMGNMRSAYSYLDSINNFNLIVAADQLFLVQPSPTPITPTAIPLRGGTAFVGSSKRPFFTQVNRIAHMSDPAGAPLRRMTDSYYEDAGIIAPSAAATIADGGAGVMVAGDYTVVYRYKNSVTGDVSDYSPVSNTLTQTANKQIDVTGLVASTQAQVDIIEVGITPPGVINGFLSAVEVANGVTTADINLTVFELGTYFINTAGLPPAIVHGHALFDDRMFVHDTIFVYYSHYLQYEVFNTSDDRLTVKSNDGHKITIIYPWGNRLVVGKPNYVMYFTPTGTGTYAPTTLSDKYGVRSPAAMRATETSLFWFDGFRFQRSDSGASPRDIGGLRIKPYLDAIPADEKDELTGEIWPERDLWVVTVPQRDSTPIVLAYNYKVEAWSVLTYPSPIMFVMEGYDANGNRLLHGLFDDGYVYQLFDDTLKVDQAAGGDSVPISTALRFKSPRADNPVNLVWLDSLFLLTTNRGEGFEAKVYEDSATSPKNETTFYCYVPNEAEWKNVALQTIQESSGANYITIELTTTEANFYVEEFKITSALIKYITRPRPELPPQN